MTSTHCFECGDKLDYLDGIIMCSNCRKEYKVPFLEEVNRTADMVDFLSKVPDTQAEMDKLGTITIDKKTGTKTMTLDDMETWLQAGGKIQHE